MYHRNRPWYVHVPKQTEHTMVRARTKQTEQTMVYVRTKQTELTSIAIAEETIYIY